MNVDVSPNLKFRYKLLTHHMLSPGLDQGRSGGSGPPPPFFLGGGGDPQTSSRGEKTLHMCV